MVYRFDQFEIDDREFRFSDDHAPVSIEPKALRLLIYLIQNQSRLVSKQELLDKVWPDAMVTESALTREIVLLRKALNENSRVPRYIETVPTMGYRFVAKVTVLEEPAEAPPAPEKSASAPAKFRASTVWVVASILLLAAVAASAFLYLHHGKRLLTEQDTVVLADFENSTGDPVFDETLRRGLAVQLEQSPYLSLIEDDRIQQVLREMDQPADARLTPEVAREICVRTSSAAVLDGSIAPLGSQYIVGLRARDCQSGKVLAEEQVQAARKEDVLHALDQVAGRFRSRVGESLSTVEKYDTPLVEATTPSLEALKAFSLADKKSSEGAWAEALPLFSRATELDPNFALAYSAMAGTYATFRQRDRAAEMQRKAYALRDKVSERERLSIEEGYYQYVTGELDKVVSSCMLRLQIYPRDAGAHLCLGQVYRRLGHDEKALEEAREAHLLSLNAGTYLNLAVNYVGVGSLDEAEAVYNEAVERNLVTESMTKSRYILYFLKGDTARMSQLAEQARGKPNEDEMFIEEAETEAWYGRWRSAREFARRAMDSAQGAGEPETAADYLAWEALYEADVGDREQSRADAMASLKMAPYRNVQEVVALALAKIGDTALAEKLAAELDQAGPVDTLLQRKWLPSIRAATALRGNDPAHAVELLQAASAYERAYGVEVGCPKFPPVYLRGQAYLMLHDGTRAAAEFQKFIDYRTVVRNSPWATLARLGLARAYAMEGDTTKARAAYEDFLAIWKDADSDIPLLSQARAEYAKL
ncbi:MAG TPA: winged helix-turn-helix domain-containing protein [Terracidiphilus sp.]|nr:winged helix-turn-helix domain-containing protein [Terracidiphilus sp.]